MFRKQMVVIRGSYVGIANGAQKVIDKHNLQDVIFPVEQNDHGFTVLADDEDFNTFIKLFIGEWSVSIIRNAQLPDYTNVMVLGKMMDSALQQRGEQLAKKLF